MTSRTAVVLPGGQNGPAAPLPMFASDAAEQRGARVLPVWWDEPDRPLSLKEEERGPWVLPQVAKALDGVTGDVVLIGKSLGTFGAALAAGQDHGCARSHRPQSMSRGDPPRCGVD